MDLLQLFGEQTGRVHYNGDPRPPAQPVGVRDRRFCADRHELFRRRARGRAGRRPDPAARSRRGSRQHGVLEHAGDQYAHVAGADAVRSRHCRVFPRTENHSDPADHQFLVRAQRLRQHPRFAASARYGFHQAGYPDLGRERRQSRHQHRHGAARLWRLGVGLRSGRQPRLLHCDHVARRQVASALAV